MCLFTESYSSDTDNIVPFVNTTPINQNKKVKIKECRAGWSELLVWQNDGEIYEATGSVRLGSYYRGYKK